MISVDRLFISAVLIFPGLARAISPGSATAIALVMTICPAVSIAAGGAAGGDDIAVVKCQTVHAQQRLSRTALLFCQT